MKKAVFLDRDGVIVADHGFVHKINDLKFIKNSVKGLKLLKKYKLIIITNQSGIGRGLYTIKDFVDFNNHMINQLRKHGIKIENTYYCPHAPEENCECRKPKIKLLREAEKEFKIDLKKSFAIGDKKIDIELGKNAGCKKILVLTGYGNKHKDEADADYTAKDMLDAAKWIIKNDK